MLFCAVVLVFLLAFGPWTQAEAAVPQFGQIVETFSVETSTSSMIDPSGANNETIARPTGATPSGFAWGGYNSTVGSVIFMSDPPPDVRGIMFLTGAWNSGSYCYTMFDTTTPLGGAARANTSSVALDMSGPAAKATLTAVAGGDTQLSILIRDHRQWWQSSTKLFEGKNIVTEPMNVIEFPFAGAGAVTWTAVAAPFDLSEMDNGGEAAITLGDPGTPNLENVRGTGIYIVSTADPGPNFDILILDELVLDGPSWTKPAAAEGWVHYK